MVGTPCTCKCWFYYFLTLAHDRRWLAVSGCTRVGQKKRKSVEWVHGTNQFLQQAFCPAAHGSDQTLCPCNDCKNQKRKVQREVYKDLIKHGFVANYKRWVFHGEAKATVREKEVTTCLEEFDGDAGVVDMVVDYNRHVAMKDWWRRIQRKPQRRSMK
jgi:DnaJ-class molecular chaperone